MLKIWWYGQPLVEPAEPCEPIYAPALDRVVACGALEVRHVDASGRMRKQVVDSAGHPLWLATELDPTTLARRLPGPGRYAVVAPRRLGSTPRPERLLRRG